MNEKVKKRNEIVVINKFKEQAEVDIKTTLEQVFKMFYEMQVNKR